MLNSAYDALRQIQNKFSEKQTIREIKTLIQGNSALDLSVHLESNLPISLAWDLTTNSLTGSCKITIFPKLVINGELYEAPFKHDFKLPVTGFAGLEAAFMSALKQSLGGVQRVWD